MATSSKLQLNDSTNHFYDKITTLIENAKDLKDLHKFIDELLPISELQQLLLTKLSNKLETMYETADSVQLEDTQNIQNINNKNTNDHKVDIYLNRLYYTLYPLDDIFSDDILCSIIQFLAAPNNEYSIANQCDFMYNALPVINKHFNDLMKQNPILYQQYTVCITINNKVSNPYLNLNVEVSHSKKTITINSNQHYHHQLISPIPRRATAENIKFSITKIDDMNKKCPFKCWYTIKKWKVNIMNTYPQPSTPPLIHIHSPQLSSSQTPPIKLQKLNTFNGDTLVYDKNSKKNKPPQKSLMEQLIETAKPFIKSVEICNNNNNRLYLHTANDLRHENKNNDQILYEDFFKSLHKLFHINCRGYQLLPFDVHNLLYLDLTVTNNNNNNNNNLMINGTLLDELQTLNHLLVFRIDLQNIYSTNLNQSIPVVYKMMLSFPKNIEFIQIDHFEDTRQTLFNFNQCENIIALVFNNSNISGYGGHIGYNTYHDAYNNGSYNKASNVGDENRVKQLMNCFIWPKENNPIQSVFIQKHEPYSLINTHNTNDSNQWHLFFQQSKLNNVPIKNIHYTNLPDLIDALLIPTTISLHDDITDIQSVDNMTMPSTVTKGDNTTENRIDTSLDDDDDDDDDAVNINLELLEEKMDQYFDDNNSKQDFFKWIEREPVSILYPNCYEIFKQLLPEKFNINTIISHLVNIYFDESVDNDALLIALKENGDCENYLNFIGELIECIKTKYQIEIDIDKYGNKEEQKQEEEDEYEEEEEEEDEEEKDTEYKHTELTHDALDKFLMEHISIETTKYDEDNVSNNKIISNISKHTTINTISHSEKKMDDYDVVDTENKIVTPLPLILNLAQLIDKDNNDKSCVMVKDSGYKFDGLLWRLLLIKKFKEERDIKFIDDRILMYREWFNMDIAKWIYHLGAYSYSRAPDTYYHINPIKTIDLQNYVIPNDNTSNITHSWHGN